MVQKIGRRVDVLAKITGQAKYTNDLSFPHMLYAKTVRCSHPHAKVISIEREQAEQYPGVVRVITADHIPGIPSQYKQKPILVSEVFRYVEMEELYIKVLSCCYSYFNRGYRAI